MTIYMASMPTGSPYANGMIGALVGLGLGMLLIGFDLLFKRYNLRSLNVAIIGLFVGFLMGKALLIVFGEILHISQTVNLSAQVLEIIQIAIFLFGLYLGTLMTLRSSDELYISIPFVRFSPTTQKRKDLIMDGSVLSDARIIDLASSGLIDKSVVLPRFILKEIYAESVSEDENIQNKAKKALSILQKLEKLPEFELRYHDTDFPDVKDPINKLVRLARLLEGNIFTADISRIQILTVEGVRIINIHSLSNALKPLMETGEKLNIKIQRYGKEPNQGVGYLEDGTMVVVNGGGSFIGEMIEAHVLSIKHTSSGRLIFCNAKEDGEEADFQTEYE